MRVIVMLLIVIIKIFDNVGIHGGYIKVQDPEGDFYSLTLRLDRFYLLIRNKEDLDFTYIISNPNMAEIKNDILLPKKEGLTQITFYDEHQNKQKTVIVNILPKSPDTFDKMRQKWKDMLLEERYYDPADSLMSNVQNKTDTEVLALWETMNKEKDRKHLWNVTKNYATSSASLSSAHVTSEFKSLYKLAAAAMNKHSRYYLKRDLLIDTISGLEWMRMNKYNNTKTNTYGYWWSWNIGSPSHILNSLIMLYPILSDDEISPYLTAIDRFVPDINHYSWETLQATGSNLVSVSKIKTLQNTLRRDEKGIIGAIEALKKIFPFATKTYYNVFHADGSFLQYNRISSTGSYGFTVLCGVSEILSLIQSTKYAIVGEEIDKIFTWINEAFAPLIYNGRFMDMVRGRTISRQFDDSRDTAKLFGAIMNIALLSSDMQVAVYKKMVKQLIANDVINSFTNYRDIYLAKKILNDSSIGTDGILGTMFKNYAKMDRVVYRNAENGFVLGISMSSQRVRWYEKYHGENKHGWFTGAGMVYLYNGDLLQFRDNFWATVDPYRLPGITVEKVKQQDYGSVKFPLTDFVGGSILDKQTGMVAMDFVTYNNNVVARKSWTVFYNKIIALGSGIKYNGKNEVETIFENRKLDKGIQYKLYINDYEVDLSVFFKNQVEKVNSIYLESIDINQSIGYKLLTPQKLTIKVENRQGAWSDINDWESSELITRKYLTIWKTHSEEINDYNYVIYPSISRKEFNEVKPVNLLKNTKYIHAVADDEGNLGVTIFTKGNYSVEDMTMTQPMVLVKKDFQNNVKIAIADPTMKRVTPYIITLLDKNYEIAVIDKNVKTVLKYGVWSIRVDPSNKLGQSSTILFTKKKVI